MVYPKATFLLATCLALSALIQPAIALPLSDGFEEDLYTSELALCNITARATTISSSLKTCFSKTDVTFVYPSDASTYSTLDVHQNSANPVLKPGVFALPNSEAQVAAVVKCVAAEGGSQKISPKSGGHTYTGYTYGSSDGWVVVDLKNLNSISINSQAKQATVAAGVKLGNLASQLGQKGFSLPHGTCPAVGVGGHGLGGGYGFSSYTWGYLLDHIASMRLVKADGSVVTVDSNSGDLWYALRGAGSNNFGVVTSFTYNLETAPKNIVNFSRDYKSNADCAQVMLAIQDITATKGTNGWPSAFGGQLLLTGESQDSDTACSLMGQYLGSKSDYLQTIAKLNTKLKASGTKASNIKATEFTSWTASLTDIMGDLSATTYKPESYYAKSLVTPSSVRYNQQTAGNLLEALSAASKYGASISLDLLGPNSYSNNVAPSSSAFVHRDALWISQYYSYTYPTTNANGGQDAVHKAFAGLINTAKAAAPSAAWGGYVNYIDNELLSENWGSFYYGGAVDRLKSIKSQVDPKTIFDFPMGISHA